MENCAPPQSLKFLNGVRAVAAVYVVACHAFLEVDFTRQRLGYATKIFLQCFFFGHFAVDLFITLSGFCLMLPVIRANGVLQGGMMHFLQRRAWRIIPPYYFAVALSLLFIQLLINQKTGTHWDVSIPVTGKSILTHLLLVQDLSGDDANINHALWSISVEWRIYLLFPLLIACWHRFGALTTAAVTVILSLVLFQLGEHFLHNPMAAHYLGLFSMGMLGASVAFPQNKTLLRFARLPWGLITIFMTVVVLLMFFPRLWDGPQVRIYLADDVIGIWSMALLAMLSRNESGWLARILSSKLLVFIGSFAYSLYLIHAPLLQILWQYVFSSFQAQSLFMFCALLLVGIPMITGFAYLFFLIFERPFLGMGKTRTQPLLPVSPTLKSAF